MTLSNTPERKTGLYLSNRSYYTVVCILLAAGFAFMTGLSGRQSFWSDEMFSLGAVSSRVSLRELTRLFLTDETCNLPLYTYFLYFWYRLVPHTEVWLQLPCVAAYCLSVFLFGQIQRKYYGNLSGLFAVVLGLASSAALFYAVWELRCYAFLILEVTAFLFLNQRIYENNRVLDRVLLGIVVCMACYTHYFAMLFIGLWFLTELIHRCAVKKLSFGWMLPYFLGGAFFLPWAWLILTNTTRAFSVFWAPTPSMDSVGKLFAFLSSDIEWIRAALVAGMVLSVLLYRSGKERSCNFFCFANTAVIFCAAALIYVYSVWINPKGSLWVQRYFLCLLPSAILLAGLAVSFLIESIPASENPGTNVLVKTVIAVSICILLLCFGGSDANKKISSMREPYREAAARILEEDPEHNSVLFYPAREEGYAYVYYYDGLGWQECYLQDAVPVISTLEEVRETLPERLFVSYLHISLDDEVKAFLSENYDEVSHDKTLKLYEYKKGRGAPRLVSAESGDKGVTVRWEPLQDAVNYRVFYKTAGGSWTKAGDTTQTSYTVSGLEAGKTYWLTVRAISEDGKDFTSNYNTVGLSCEYVPAS